MSGFSSFLFHLLPIAHSCWPHPSTDLQTAAALDQGLSLQQIAASFEPLICRPTADRPLLREGTDLTLAGTIHVDDDDDDDNVGADRARTGRDAAAMPGLACSGPRTVALHEDAGNVAPLNRRKDDSPRLTAACRHELGRVSEKLSYHSDHR